MSGSGRTAERARRARVARLSQPIAMAARMARAARLARTTAVTSRGGGCARGRGVAARGVSVRRRAVARATAHLAPVKLTGVGSAVPEVVMTNDELGEFLDTSDEWIRPRTGIAQRRLLGTGETMTALAADAVAHALEMSGLEAHELDMIVLCTSTPEDTFGGAAAVQAAVGAGNAVAYDLTAACSGFVLGLVTACNHIRVGGPVRRVAVIGADSLSRTLDWDDRSTAILFGDGCGAVIVERADDEDAECALLGYDMRSDGTGSDNLHCRYAGDVRDIGAGGVSVHNKGEYNYLAMNGQEVFKFAVRAVPQVVNGALEMAGMVRAREGRRAARACLADACAAGLAECRADSCCVPTLALSQDAEEIDWLVMHQANARILDSAAKKVGIDPAKVASNLAKYGNTSAASVPLVLDEYVRTGKIKPGDVLATAGFGAGLTWASALVRWG